jgi:hypothetical protein
LLLPSVYLDHCVPLEVVLKALQLQLQHRREVIKQHSLARILHTGRDSTHRKVHRQFRSSNHSDSQGGRRRLQHKFTEQQHGKDGAVKVVLFYYLFIYLII